MLTDPEGSFSSPNHPGSYPPNSLCVWVIRVPPSSLVQIHVSSLTVEGPSPCLFDWLEVQEQVEQGSVVTRLVMQKQICEDKCHYLKLLLGGAKGLHKLESILILKASWKKRF